jgi:hypothetical protein
LLLLLLLVYMAVLLLLLQEIPGQRQSPAPSAAAAVE